MRLIYAALLFFITLSATYACDVCGCQLGGLAYGIMPQYHSHFVGLRYSQASFNAAIENTYLEDESSYDTYQRMELMGRYSISRQWQVNAIVPYNHNRMEGSHQDVTSSGTGDPMLLVYYNPIHTMAADSTPWQHALLIGGGIKLPFGEYQKTDQGQIINRNFQLGSGSLDYLMSGNYTLRRQNAGFNLEASVKINTSNSEGYQFGNQWNISSYGFYSLSQRRMTLLPYAGLYFEQAGRHSVNGHAEKNTGGTALLATLGTQVYLGPCALNLQYQTPLTQNYQTDDITTIQANDRLMVSLLYNFTLQEGFAFE